MGWPIDPRLGHFTLVADHEAVLGKLIGIIHAGGSLHNVAGLDLQNSFANIRKLFVAFADAVSLLRGSVALAGGLAEKFTFVWDEARVPRDVLTAIHFI